MAQHTIMVVDDEEELRENLKDLLEFKGYQVIPADTGEEALERFDPGAVDLVLLDIQLPGINGLEVLKAIKTQSPATPVAMVSASSVQQVIEQAKSLGADKIIVKPYNLEQMLDAIQQLLRQAQAE